MMIELFALLNGCVMACQLVVSLENVIREEGGVGKGEGGEEEEEEMFKTRNGDRKKNLVWRFILFADICSTLLCSALLLLL